MKMPLFRKAFAAMIAVAGGFFVTNATRTFSVNVVSEKFFKAAIE